MTFLFFVLFCVITATARHRDATGQKAAP